MMKDIWALIVTLGMILVVYIILVLVNGTNPKLMDLALVVGGGIVTMATHLPNNLLKGDSTTTIEHRTATKRKPRRRPTRKT